MQKLLLGSLIALGMTSAAFAQSASTPAPSNPPAASAPSASTPAASMPSQSSAMTASTLPTELKSHLSPGAQIYSGDKVVASVASVDAATGKVVISETAGTGAPASRVLPTSSLTFSNGRLATSLTAEQISKLPVS